MLMKHSAQHDSLQQKVLGAVGCLVSYYAFVYWIQISQGAGGLSSPQQQKEKHDYRYYYYNYNSEECKALMNHDHGHWEHLYDSPLLNNSNINFLSGLNASLINKKYLPIELDWMRGKELPPNWGCQGDIEVTYISKVGHQCGCLMPSFRPSLSTWVPAVDTSSVPVDAATEMIPLSHEIISPSLRFIMQLAKENRSLCFAGDSIDLQFYDALRHNLQRQIKLQTQINISLHATSIPVNYTNETGVPLYTGWMTMDRIEETTVFLKYNADKAGETYFARFRYFQMYGWSPWVTPFMDDCDVAIFNIGLHYDAHGEMRGTHFGSPKFNDDIQAVITHMTDLASMGDRIAVWRSVLPQHFDSVDGHWSADKQTNCSVKTRKADDRREIQNYNTVANDAFSTHCNAMRRDPPFCSHRHEYNCIVNRTNSDIRTVYKFLLDNNCTERVSRFKHQPIVSGQVLQWSIADLFDVPQWHSQNGDCSHFCYIVPLYEAAFERLMLMLPNRSPPAQQ